MSIVTAPKSGFQGFFHIEKYRNGRKTYESSFPNVITDWGLDALGTRSIADLTARCSLGTGSTPPQVSDVHLENRILTVSGSSSTGRVDPGGTPGNRGVYARRRCTFTFSEGSGNHNFTEVGVGRNATDFPLWSRQLLRDQNGNPTTVTKLNDERLVVTYELRLYPYSEGVIDGGVQDILGQDFQTRFYLRWSNFGLNHTRATDQYSGAAYRSHDLGSDLFLPTHPTLNTITSSSSVSWLSYVSGSHYQDVRITFSPGSFNSQEVRGFGVPAFLGTSSGFSSPTGWFWGLLPMDEVSPDAIGKDQFETLQVTFRHSWGRHAA